MSVFLPIKPSNKIVSKGCIIYSINEEEKTASVVGYRSSKTHVIIPRSIDHELKEYTVISISKLAFKYSSVEIVEFDVNSEVQTIEKEAFSASTIMRVFLPASVVRICEGAFSHCHQLVQVEIPPDSELRTIEKYAFLETLISSFSIPEHVMKIGEGAFSDCPRLANVEIPPNSELQAIEKKSFASAQIKSILIPASVVELEEGWGIDMFKLTQIEVDKMNRRYSSVDGKYIIGKSDINKDDYDTLIFAVCDFVEANIPKPIKIIAPYAFFESKLVSVSIPAQVTHICRCAFSNCSQLVHVEIPQNSELKIIEKDAFYFSKIENISIPASVLELKEGWCTNTEHLVHVKVDERNPRYSCVDDKYIIGKSDINQEEYDTLVFAVRDIVNANIPSTIKIIAPYAFSESKLVRISIPAHVTHICEGAFSCCKELEQIEFPPNSELRTIGKYAFCGVKITRISIPASVVELEEGWCINTGKLAHVEVDERNQRYSCIDGKYIVGKSDVNQEEYDTLIFAVRDITKASIPSTIKIIGSYAFEHSRIKSIHIPAKVTQICESAFSDCYKLVHVEIPPNSELRTIGKYAFSGLKIPSISIPIHVKQICESSFSYCNQLVRVEIPLNSELKTIEKSAFLRTKIESVLIPPCVDQIHDTAFYLCPNLRIIEFNEQLVNELKNEIIFWAGKDAIIMIPVNKNE